MLFEEPLGVRRGKGRIMTKLVFANELRDETPAETKARDGRNPYFWFDGEEMPRLLSAAWRTIYMLGEASRFVEVLRVHFKHDLVNPSRLHKGVTDIVFEAVFVNPGSGKKEEGVVLLRLPSDQFSRPETVEEVSRWVLGRISGYLRFSCQNTERAVGQAQKFIAHLAQYE